MASDDVKRVFCCPALCMASVDVRTVFCCSTDCTDR